MYNFNDALFLASFMHGKWMTTEEIKRTGEPYNNAILTQNEIDSALEKLIPAGYVEIKGGQYRATKKANKLTNFSFSYWLAGQYDIPDIVLKKLNKQIYSK